MLLACFILPEDSSSSTSSREKVRGSPRFPHRIMPANSLSTIGPGQLSAVGTPHRWHSMEDSWKPRLQPGRGSCCSHNADVSPPSLQELGIPLSELRRAAVADRSADLSPCDDGKLGGDLRELFRENSLADCTCILYFVLCFLYCSISYTPPITLNVCKTLRYWFEIV